MSRYDPVKVDPKASLLLAANLSIETSDHYNKMIITEFIIIITIM